MLLDTIVEMKSKELLTYHTEAKIQVDLETGKMTKEGKQLKPGDSILVDGESWTVSDFSYNSALSAEELKSGGKYDIPSARDGKILRYSLDTVDKDFGLFAFVPEEEGQPDINFGKRSLPAIFHRGSGREEPNGIVLERGHSKQTLDFDEVKNETYTLSSENSHVILASGKPQKSKTHYYVTTEEPYAVCCIEGKLRICLCPVPFRTTLLVRTETC